MILAIVITAIVFFFLGIAVTYIIIIGSSEIKPQDYENKS
jgi:hypothetical protein